MQRVQILLPKGNDDDRDSNKVNSRSNELFRSPLVLNRYVHGDD